MSHATPRARQPGSPPDGPELQAQNSRQATTAVLQSSPSRPHTRLTVQYSDPSMHTELSVGGEVLWSGPWQWEVRCNGVPAADRSPWEVVCRACRRRRGLPGVADRVGRRPADRASSRARPARPLPPAGRRCAGRSTGGTAILRAIAPLWGNILSREQGDCRGPPSSAETNVWRRWRRWGCPRVAAAGSRASCRQTANPRGSRLGNSSCSRRPMPDGCSLRCGSISIRTDNAAADVAAAQRRPGDASPAGRHGRRFSRRRRKAAMAGLSIACQPGNRTLLGHNLTSETLVARFHRNGRVQPLIEVE